MTELEAQQAVDEAVEEQPSWPEEQFKREPLTFWQKVRRLLFQSRLEKRRDYSQRIEQLSVAIQDFPESAASYLLRGELRLETDQYELARGDLQRALELARSSFEGERWGIASQAIIDRALIGLREIEHHLD